MSVISFSSFSSLVSSSPSGVVLLEGKREIPEKWALEAARVGEFLAREFPLLRFRSGGADGADEAFSRGVVKVDPSRLHIIAPYSTHRKNARHEGAVYDSPESLPKVAEEAAAYRTVEASPKNKGLIESRGKGGASAAKAKYLIRDTLKVTGIPSEHPKAMFALFYVDPKDPMAGGTGHTIRVCELESVPFAFQDSWKDWGK